MAKATKIANDAMAMRRFARTRRVDFMSELPQIKIVMSVDGNSEKQTFVIPRDVLAHMFTAHSLNINSWVKEGRTKLKEEIESITESGQQERLDRKCRDFIELLESVERRHKHADVMEAAFKELTLRD